MHPAVVTQPLSGWGPWVVRADATGPMPDSSPGRCLQLIGTRRPAAYPRPPAPRGRRASRPTPAPPAPVATVAECCRWARHMPLPARLPQPVLTGRQRVPARARALPPWRHLPQRGQLPAVCRPTHTPAPTRAALCALQPLPLPERGHLLTGTPHECACLQVLLEACRGGGGREVWGHHRSPGGWRAAGWCGARSGMGAPTRKCRPGQACCDTLVLLPSQEGLGIPPTPGCSVLLAPCPASPRPWTPASSRPPGGPYPEVPWDHVTRTLRCRGAPSPACRPQGLPLVPGEGVGRGAGAHTWLPQ